jgi:glycosyltransferase involved in cell wall biosynthesis
VRALTQDLDLDSFIVFTGYRSGETLIANISAFDIGVIPDPVNECNDLMSMNKVFEYCALGIPTVTYNLVETKRLLGETGVYAPTNDPEGLAAACLGLMQDDDWRRECGERALRLSKEKFVWDIEAAKYVAVFESVLESRSKVVDTAAGLGQAE